jgi:hypothetical protein
LEENLALGAQFRTASTIYNNMEVLIKEIAVNGSALR